MNDDKRPDDDLSAFADTLLRDQLDAATRGATPDVDAIIRASETQARRQQTRSRVAWVAGLAAVATFAVWGGSQLDLRSVQDGGRGLQPATNPPTEQTVSPDTVVPATARGLAAAVVSQLGGAQIQSIEGRTVDQALSQQVGVQIKVTYGDVPATLTVTAWQPGSEGFDPGAISCSSQKQVQYGHRTLQDPPADIVEFGCTPDLFPQERSEWWVAADTVQPDDQGGSTVKRIGVLAKSVRGGIDVSNLRPNLQQLESIALDDAVGAFTTQRWNDAGESLQNYTDVQQFSQ